MFSPVLRRKIMVGLMVLFSLSTGIRILIKKGPVYTYGFPAGIPIPESKKAPLGIVCLFAGILMLYILVRRPEIFENAGANTSKDNAPNIPQKTDSGVESTILVFNRIYSGIIGIIYLFIASKGGIRPTAWVGGYLVFALGLIWFAEQLSKYFAPYYWKNYPEDMVYGGPTSARITRIGGWVLLFLPAVGIMLFGMRWIRGQGFEEMQMIIGEPMQWAMGIGYCIVFIPLVFWLANRYRKGGPEN